VLLLRTAIAGLRARGDSCTLLAPTLPASVLADEVEEVWDLDGAASLFAGDPSPVWKARLGTCGRARVVSRSPELQGSLRGLIPDVEVIDPLPARGHAAAWYASGLPTATPQALRPTPEELSAVAPVRAALPEAFLALHPGSGSPSKNWPFFAELARTMGGAFLLVEGPADAESAAPLRSLPGARLASNLPLRQLGGLLSQAGVLVAGDSGVAHLAAAFGGQVLSLFGPTNPEGWAPQGPGVSWVEAPGGDLRRLEVGAVAARVRQRMGRL
jgi:hypothetical protein